MRSGHRASSLALAAASCVALAGAPRDALAEPSSVGPDGGTRQAMDAWFLGERREAAVFVGAGVLSLSGGVLLLSRDDGLAQGAGATYAVMGGLLTAFALSYVAPLDGQSEALRRQLARDPAAFDREETARMQGIADRFVLYRWAEIAVGATGVGLAIGGAAAEEDVVAGVGIGLATEAAVLLVLDAFAEARAHRYRDHLERWQPAVAVGPDGGAVGLRRSF